MGLPLVRAGSVQSRSSASRYELLLITDDDAGGSTAVTVELSW
ncbi:hypothetical protein [Hymenobacter weizhouensis]|nr:hypothetical protein [Hymenobacter sp. YIM 151500-1]UYZ64969.1 hypothetical protein OIS53_08980 [Hymenobacter sp. YIM 151500-1]